MRGGSHGDSEVGSAGPCASAPFAAPSNAPPRWQFLLLAKVANYTLLRRQLGLARVGRLIADLSASIAKLIAGSRVVTTGRDLIEVAFESESREHVDTVLVRLHAMFGEPIEIGGEQYDLELLVGAATCDGPTADEVRLMERAERSLAQADRERRAVICDADDPADDLDRVALAQDLAHAIARDELFLQYQPKVDLRQHRVASVEALIRWRHPTRGLVLPGDFIPLAEETRAITALSLWTIRQALADQAVLAAAGHPLRVFVNISGVLLSDPAFVAHAAAMVRGVADRIGFEVTETAVIRDPEIAIANLQVLADLGVEIAIDDYGAGLSSLAYLKRLPARELKIDKLFVTQLTSTNRDPLIVRSTIDLAHALDMAVVAEGVEEQAALALLAVMGCDMAQGFLISRPVCLDALITFLQDGRHAEALQESRATFSRLAATWKRAS